MTHDPQKLQDLEDRLKQLLHKQDVFQVELHRLQRDINTLKQTADHTEAPDEVEPIKPSIPLSNTSSSSTQLTTPPLPEENQVEQGSSIREKFNIPSKGLDLEKFIGENLISKIGILITVIGVAFGAKYAIDHELISPLTRIILGYLAGVGLLGVAMRLKPKYESFSAVLLSGALAILYIITFFAYSYYGLFPQAVAFALMVLFTAFTVLAAWHYNRQVIALIGLVGAYAVPFLLSENSGQVLVLLSYMAIINAGILVVSFRKHWKTLFHLAFWLSWFIFSWWMVADYQLEEHFGTALFFVTVFYLLFYATLLAYKLSKQEPLQRADILLLLANSFIFFGFGYVILGEHSIGEQLLGVFAIANAALHFGVGLLIKKYDLADRNLFYFVIGLVLVFLTIAIPIQLDGNWVTLLWAGEAALLYWMGRSKGLAVFEKLALPMIALAFVSLLQDWSMSYGRSYFSDLRPEIRPVFNIHMLSSVLFIGAFAFMNWVQQATRFPSTIKKGHWIGLLLRFAIPGILLLVAYFAFRSEIEYYWQHRYNVVTENNDPTRAVFDYSLLRLKNIWIVYYSLIFLTLLSWANMLRINSRLLGWINLGLNAVGILAFLGVGLYELSELRDYHIQNPGTEHAGFFSAGMLRYLGYGLVGLLLFTTYRYQQRAFVAFTSKWAFDALLHLSILWITSAELIHWMALSDSENSYKLGLSILWGVYSLFLIALGIGQRKAHLRIGAIGLFALTLIKLFFYDIAHLNTMAKTIVLVSLGLLLLVISFLYNKFKDVIADETDA